MKRLVLIIVFIIALNIIICGNYYCAYACFGARPMAMGGAFAGVADDIHAVYWNPAGIGQIRQKEFTYSATLPGSRDNFNHDDFVACIFPVSESNANLGTIGIWFVNSGFNKSSYKDVESWYAISYGKEIMENL